MAVKKGKNLKKNIRGRKTNHKPDAEQQTMNKLRTEIKILIMLAVSVVLFIGVLGGGKGPLVFIGGFLFGLFGVLGYIFPVALFVLYTFLLANENNKKAGFKAIGIVFLFLSINTLIHLLSVDMEQPYHLASVYLTAIKTKVGGGVIGSLLALLMYRAIGKIASVFVLFTLIIIALILLTQKSFFGGIKKGSDKLYKTTVSGFRKRKEEFEKAHEASVSEEEIAQKVGVFDIMEKFELTKQDSDASISMSDPNYDAGSEMLSSDTDKGMRELDLSAYEMELPKVTLIHPLKKESFCEPEHRNTGGQNEDKSEETEEIPQTVSEPDDDTDVTDGNHPVISTMDLGMLQEVSTPDFHPDDTKETGGPVIEEASESEKQAIPFRKEETTLGNEDLEAVEANEAKREYRYIPPSLDLLKKGRSSLYSLNQTEEIKKKLAETFRSFHIDVTMTEVSVGPTVTRYELMPAPGVKVSRIQALSDDIKMALAAADIRIEAPIPGKSAVGIEVPNEENSTVMLRTLLEDEEFKNSKCMIPFAVGKDLANKTIVEDIDKMPHLLIAGATGSGKSVCINTLIMSILYKAHPKDVKLIMIDPKVVELSIYNGIPHLLTPIVTDPRKAAGALNWAVAEMTKRYKLFAAVSVRDLKGYNRFVNDPANAELVQEEGLTPLPQIVIIVDELADLMMVSAKEAEEAICRLAQLARAAGMHLIIATQRPSVNVITGLIKANMPSRIAFAVTSGVDSRTILDMNGAEKLLGKGDMLFGPQWLQKPIRLQGAFVSDQEVDAVTSYLKKQGELMREQEATEENVDEEITQAMNSVLVNDTAESGSESELDPLFEDAVRLVLEKDKASIGMLQRALKIGFNRAGRIMDQMEAQGIVGSEDGTKPRAVLIDSTSYADNGEK